ncbi:MAG: HAMP domain-containing histidine kinase, partial [Ignavibacteriae bacterium]|nr:HAMP domain-containing histidine kinase [Ignavibacteriota bacterium]
YSQRQLLEAESLTLTLDISAINSINLIQGVIDLVRYYDFSRNVTIELSSNSQEFELLTDSTLLRRVLTNLLKNACEAEYPDGNVNIGCIKQDYNAYFWVNNKSVMPKDVQLQLFQRSFSTKGKGRGVGTYSVKLLTEKYLRGSVDFYSNEEKGTLFNLYIPLTYEN